MISKLISAHMFTVISRYVKVIAVPKETTTITRMKKRNPGEMINDVRKGP